MSSLKTPQAAVRSVGEFIREQRAGAQISLRELAKQAGISNPYLSQIERGLRRPSADILQQIAKALQISAETLFVHAGILDPKPVEGVEIGSADDDSGPDVRGAILRDTGITDRQKQVLLDIYQTFHRENAALAGPAPEPSPPVADAL